MSFLSTFTSASKRGWEGFIDPSQQWSGSPQFIHIPTVQQIFEYIGGTISGDGSIIGASESFNDNYLYRQYGDQYYLIGNNIGRSIRLSGDGSTFISYSVTSPITIQVYNLNLQNQQTLVTTLGAGSSFDISDDGNTIIVGSSEYNGTYDQQGAVFVYTKTGSAWSLTSTLLDTIYPARLNGLGDSVAISGDGNTILASNYGNDSYIVFTRSGSSWIRNTPILPVKTFSGRSLLAISGDGLSIRMDQFFYKKINGVWTSQTIPFAAAVFNYDGTVAVSTTPTTVSIWTYTGTWILTQTLQTITSPNFAIDSVDMTNNADVIVVGVTKTLFGYFSQDGLYIYRKQIS